MEKKKHTCTVGGNANWYSHYEEQYGYSLKKIIRNKTIMWPNNPVHGSKLDIHQQMNGWKDCGTYVQWNITQP